MKNLIRLLFVLALGLLELSLAAQTWERYIGTDDWEAGGAITTTTDKGFVVAARRVNQIYVARLDQDGILLWENTYLGNHPAKEDVVFKVIETVDGGFALTGKMGLADPLNYDVFLLKIDKDGNEEFTRSFGGPDEDIGYSLVETAQGYLLAGAYGITFENNADQVSTSSTYLIKVDKNGNEEWIKKYGDTLADYAHSILHLENGEFAVFGVKGIPERGIDYAYLRINSDGDSLFTKTYGIANEDNWGTNAISIEGGFLETGYTHGQGTYLIRYLENGDTLWTKQLDHGQNNNFEQYATLSKDGIIYNLSTILNEIDENFLLTAIDPTTGNELWSKEIGKPTESERSTAIAITDNGTIALLGTANRLTVAPDVQADILLTNVNEVGNSLNFHIRGQVFIEETANCSSTGGVPLANWLIEAKKGETSYYALTDEHGQYDLLSDTGTYGVRVIPKSPYWQPCLAAVSIEATEFGETTIDFGIQKAQICPYLLVDISTPFLKTCDTAIYTIKYENVGTDTAIDIFIELNFPPELEILSLSDSLQKVDAHYIFTPKNTLAPFEKGSFQLKAFLDCEVIPQSTQTVTAHIYPEPCVEPNDAWDGASLKITKHYLEDSVKLVIQNQGEDMINATSFVVIEDLVILRQGTLLLEENDSLSIVLPKNNRTYRLEVRQVKGNSRPALSVEAFATDIESPLSTGFVTQFYEDDGNSFISIDAQENQASIPSNRLIAAPKGIGINHLITPKEEDIEYQISFPIFKMEEDTFRLVIRDSLSEYLDLSTFQAGTSSHEYSVAITETGILKFIFEDLAAPEQDTTYGFVKFRVGQKETNQEGILIENKVSFYRDYELPKTFYVYQHNTGKEIRENTVEHYYCEGIEFEAIPPRDTVTTFSIDIEHINETIILSNITTEIDSFISNNEERILVDTFVAHNGCDSIVVYNLITDIKSVELAPQTILIYPNPVQNQVSITCKNQRSCLRSIQLFNTNGQLVTNSNLNAQQNEAQLNLEFLPNDLYILRIVSEGGGIYYKKILVLH